MNRPVSEVSLCAGRLRLTRFDLVFLAFVLVFIFLQLFIWPFLPVYVEGDQMLPVSNAMRLLDGETMYRDFFHIAPPGAELWYALFFLIFGIKVWVVNATVFLLAAAQLALIFVFSKRILGRAYIYLPTLIYFVIGFRPFGIDGSNRLFSVVLVLGAALLISHRHDTKILAIAGALCGLSSFFVQTRGVLGIGAIGLYLLWLNWNESLEFRKLFRQWFVAGSAFLITVAITQFYMAWLGGFDNYFFANVIFLKDYYGSDTLSNTFAYFTDIPDLNAYTHRYGIAAGAFRYLRVAGATFLFYALVPLTYVIFFFYRKFRNVERTADRDLVLLSIIGTILFLGASAPTAFRLYHISIPAVVVAVWLMSRFIPNLMISRIATAALATLAVIYCVQRQSTAHTELNLPAGRAVFLSEASSEKYSWLAAQMKPGEYVYDAQHPTFYFPLHLRNPTPYYLVRDNNYTPAFQVDRLLRSLEELKPRMIVWQGLWSKEPDDRKPGDNLAPLWEFIQTNYRLRKEFRESGEFTFNSERDIEFWEIKEAPKL